MPISINAISYSNIRIHALLDSITKEQQVESSLDNDFQNHTFGMSIDDKYFQSNSHILKKESIQREEKKYTILINDICHVPDDTSQGVMTAISRSLPTRWHY